MKRLRSSQEIGSLVGNLLAALLFPALRQFLPALVLLLPLAVVSSQPAPQASPTPTAIKAPTHCPGTDPVPFKGWSWGVCLRCWRSGCGRSTAAGASDFGMVLAAYGLGRASRSVDASTTTVAALCADLRPVAAQPTSVPPGSPCCCLCRSESWLRGGCRASGANDTTGR